MRKLPNDTLERPESSMRNAVRRLEPRVVADAFVASLSSHRLDWRSAFGSYVVFANLAKHDKVKSKSCPGCGVCGLLPGKYEDLNVLNFERLKWGGVRHDYPAFAMLDLELFDRGPKPAPTPADVGLFRDLVAAIEAAPEGTTSANLHKLLPKGLKGNKSERDDLIAVLGYCGVLGTGQHPGYGDRFVRADERTLPDRRFVDMSYPACWWRREDGINRGALTRYFGHLTGWIACRSVVAKDSGASAAASGTTTRQPTWGFNFPMTPGPCPGSNAPNASWQTKISARSIASAFSYVV